jgi:hypothetical protein
MSEINIRKLFSSQLGFVNPFCSSVQSELNFCQLLALSLILKFYNEAYLTLTCALSLIWWHHERIIPSFRFATVPQALKFRKYILLDRVLRSDRCLFFSSSI